MPGKGYAGGRWNYAPTDEEEKEINDLFNSDFEIPENFKPTAKVFDPQQENIKQLSRTRAPGHQMNPQTVSLCETLAIDDPISLIEQTESVSLADLTTDDTDLTFQVTRNEDEIQLDDSDDDDDDVNDSCAQVKTESKFKLNLPSPKNIAEDNDKVAEKVEPVTSFKSKLSLPPPKNTGLSDEITESIQNPIEKEEKQESPPKKVFKRRNYDLYSKDDD